MRGRIAPALVLTGLLGWGAGCKKQIDQTEFKSALNKSFAGRHECVWPEPVKLPAQVDTSKDEKTRDYDALTDAGLRRLVRNSIGADTLGMLRWQGLKPETYFAALMARLKPCRCYNALPIEFFRSL